MQIDCQKESVAYLYSLIISIVVPRPIAWISSKSKDGIANLAPFSFFNAFSIDPPILGVGIGSKRVLDQEGEPSVRPKDTFLNIEETGEFVVNIVTEDLAVKMNQSSASYPFHIDEFERTGLTPMPSVKVSAPRLKESRVSMECELFQIIPLGKTNLVLGKILYIHVDQSIYKEGQIDPRDWQPVGRLGGESYCRGDSIFELSRPEL